MTEQKATFFEAKKSPIPQGIESEKKVGKKRIISWGADNLYPQWLNQLFHNNAIHSGIIRSKVHYTTSGGLGYDGDENDQEDQLRWQQFLSNGASDYDLNEIMQMASLDFEIANKFIIKGRWSLDFSRVEKVELIDFEKARKLIDSDDIIVSNDWSNKNESLKVYRVLDLSVKGGSGQREREFYIEYQERSKQYKDKDSSKLSKGCYPSPPYSGGLSAICTGIEIDAYQNAEIMNGFSLGSIINLNNGEPKNDDDKKRLEKALKSSSTGANQAGGVMVLYNNGKDREASVTNLNGNDLNSRYIEVNKDTQKNILRAHSVTTPILFGFKEEGTLGNATELEIGYAIMKSNYFRSRQNALLSVINYIATKCNGLKGSIYFNQVELDLPTEEQAVEQPTVQINQSYPSQADFKSDDDQKSAEERLVAALSKVGRSKASFSIAKQTPVEDHTKLNEQQALEDFQREHFDEHLDDDDINALNLINEGNDFNNVRKALGMKSIELAKLYQRLIQLKLMNPDGGLTQAGVQQSAIRDIEKMEILYSYELRFDAPALVEGGKSRDFCVKLIELGRLYTREEIDLISSQEGRDVWTFKGGWYHDPDQDRNFPFCRHTWMQNVVFT